jgi:hypothetical protein
MMVTNGKLHNHFRGKCNLLIKKIAISNNDNNNNNF